MSRSNFFVNYVLLTKYISAKNHFSAKTKLVLDSPRCPLTTLKISAALEKVSFLLFFPLLLILGGLGGLGGSRYAGSPKFWVSIFLVLDSILIEKTRLISHF